MGCLPWSAALRSPVISTPRNFYDRFSALSLPPAVSTVIKILVTQYFIFMGWILFRVSDVNDIWYCVTQWIFIDLSTIIAGFTKYSDILKLNAVLLVCRSSLFLCSPKSTSLWIHSGSFPI
jgi:D-alanyl-lipoteichoic acid acyltransferase DltB (MBOAT superfamily)